MDGVDREREMFSPESGKECSEEVQDARDNDPEDDHKGIVLPCPSGVVLTVRVSLDLCLEHNLRKIKVSCGSNVRQLEETHEVREDRERVGDKPSNGSVVGCGEELWLHPSWLNNRLKNMLESEGPLKQDGS